MSTTYGFSLRRRQRTATGGGGSGVEYSWKRDTLAQSVAWVSGGLIIPLTETPSDPDAINAYYQTTPLQPGDYTYLTGPSRIRIDFDGDPALEMPETGIVNFWFNYPYEV